MQSAYHNLPTINGVTQKAGRRYAAQNVTYEHTEDFAQLKMDIAPAYPNEAGLNSWLRTVRLNRGREVKVIDSFNLKTPSRDIAQNLITPCEIVRNQPGALVLKDTKSSLQMTVRYDPGTLILKSETIQIDDAKLSQIWGPRVYRLVLTPKTEIVKDIWTLRFTITEPEVSSGL
jgi:hypothetical protein